MTWFTDEWRVQSAVIFSVSWSPVRASIMPLSSSSSSQGKTVLIPRPLCLPFYLTCRRLYGPVQWNLTKRTTVWATRPTASGRGISGVHTFVTHLAHSRPWFNIYILLTVSTRSETTKFGGETWHAWRNSMVSLLPHIAVECLRA